MYITKEKLVEFLEEFPSDTIIRLFSETEDGINKYDFNAIEVYYAHEELDAPVIYFTPDLQDMADVDGDEYHLIEDIMGYDPDAE